MPTNAELMRERRARLAAERILVLRQQELEEANVLLGRKANELSEEVIVHREAADLLREQTDLARHELVEAQSEINIAKRRLWDSLETIEDGFAVFDTDHRMVVANTAYLSVFEGLEMVAPGVRYSALVSLMTEEGIADIAEEPPQDWRKKLMERWAQPSPDPMTIRLWNGRYIKLIDRRSTDGDTVSLALDITDTIRNQRKLERAKARAQAGNRAKSSFLARMSHELRTPMNGVVGMADLLAETPLDDEQKLFVETIRSSGNALLDIINDVLDFSKLEAQRFTLVNDAFDLRALVADIVRLFKPALQTKPVTLAADIAENIPPAVKGDAGRVRQILMNLVGNAVKFTAEGEVALNLDVEQSDQTDGVTIRMSVRDTGLGIPKSQQQFVFGEFNQVDDETNRKFEGTGLGLSITRQLTELMGGQIWVESEEGVGSEFTVRLPMELPPPIIAAKEETEPKPTAPRMKVLAAEDNATNRLVFQKLVKQLNIDLEFAENGLEAIERWQSFQPDLIFMDISMPAMDGKDATLEIRAREDACVASPVFIVALTAHAMSGDEERGLMAGMDHYLTKPLKKADIFEAIQSAMPEGVAPVFPEEGAEPHMEEIEEPIQSAHDRIRDALGGKKQRPASASLDDTAAAHATTVGKLAETKRAWSGRSRTESAKTEVSSR